MYVEERSEHLSLCQSHFILQLNFIVANEVMSQTVDKEVHLSSNQRIV